MNKKNIIILGGGFAGIYTAMHLERLLSNQKEYELILVNKENYFVYQPMLAEIVGGSLGIVDSVSPIHRLLPKTSLHIREIDSIDVNNKTVTLAPQFSHTSLVLHYEHIVFALGNSTDFRSTRGLYQHALPFKNLSDALTIRNHLISVLEASILEKDPILRKKLLTFVVAGGGFSGTELAAEMNDFIQTFAKRSHGKIDPDEIEIYLVHSKERLMDREISESLSRYAEKILRSRGVNILFGAKLISATPEDAILNNGTRIECKTIIATAPSSANSLLETLDLPLEKKRLKTDRTLQVIGKMNVWAAGDCAYVPLAKSENEPCPPTAQFAIRQAKVLAHNIYASIHGKKKKTFNFTSLGMLGALGHHSAVAELFGCIKISGLLAWFLWRALYWVKLPGFDRKVRVAFSWLIDMLIPQESVQLKLGEHRALAEVHYEPGEIIFHEGDAGDYLYIIIDGKIEIYTEREGKKKSIATLSKGEIFGEQALLNERTRSATAGCLESSDILALKKADFGALISNLKEFREKVEELEKERTLKNKKLREM